MNMRDNNNDNYQIQVCETTDTLDITDIDNILIESDSESDSGSDLDPNTVTDSDPNKVTDSDSNSGSELVSNVTEIIKLHMQNLMMFNYEFSNLFQLFEKSTDQQKHNIILTDDMPHKMKATMLGFLRENDFLKVMMNDKHLMQEVLMYLNDACFLILIFTLTDEIIVPMLIKSRTFLTKNRVGQLKKFGSDLYGLDYYHIIANNIDTSSSDILSESIKCIEPNILPDDSIDANNVIRILSDYISTSGIELLEYRLSLHTDRDKIIKTLNYTSSKRTLDNLSRPTNTLSGPTKWPIKWLVDIGEIIISTSADVLKIK
jgi:hypothetical protein